ncbi:hypothetical protein KJ940_19890 [Myxococcota bacterium]|nr:hypothetical protein [Myxococcota bacterium]
MHPRLFALTLLLAACGDPGVKYEDRTLNIALNGCMGEVAAAAEAEATTCRGRLSAAVAEADVNGCFLVRQTAEGSATHGLPLRWREGRMAFASEGTLPLAVGQRIEAEVFLFREEITAKKCQGELSFGAACDEASGCLIKLIQGPSLIGAEGLDFDFGAAAGACVTEGPLSQSPEAELCDGADNDCDGEIDEGDPGAGADCDTGEQGVCAAGVTECVEGATRCRRLQASSVELCGDGLDNNCDGQEDEGITWRPGGGVEPVLIGQPCALGVGACRAAGIVVCDPEDDQRGACDAAPSAPLDEICDGLDNDCDGVIDNGFNLGVACTVGVGACAREGLSVCHEGGLGCDALPGEPELEICDDVDNNCDGVVDEVFPDLGERCDVGIGACAQSGEMICAPNQADTMCSVTARLPVTEVCGDGVDNDCDGVIDDGFEQLGVACEVGVGACLQRGRFICDPSDNTLIRCSVDPLAPAPNDPTCDGVDDDCDGVLDEDFTSRPSECGVGECFNTGEIRCIAHQEADSCVAHQPAFNDPTCDGLDDDCDGVNDEDFPSEDTACGVGACAAMGQTFCVRGQITDSCVPGAPSPSDPTCDGRDDDCDGVNDEDFQDHPSECGVGACYSEGDVTCEAGVAVDSCLASAPAPDDVTCDGVDDNCNGQIDEGYVRLDTACGVGACAAVGQTFCVTGGVTDSCTEGDPAANDPTCDGRDDDCDGEADEDFQGPATTCGSGACSAVGEIICRDGAQVNTCQEGNSAPNDLTCDGVDDDCNGRVDDDYVSQDTACGVGVCANTGRTFCVNGAVIDSCEPRASSPNDPTCDGRDDDCDGQVDEDFQGAATTCGVGACQRNGVTVCQGGRVVDTCRAGNPAANDATCNGVDDDCNGIRDEDFVSQDTRCGVGECFAVGRTFCVNGSLTDSCVPGEPADDDPSCDGRDDDCDEIFDEDFVVEATACGVGDCASTGQRVCQDGQIINTCAPGAPAANDATCDGVDDDCDGLTDEDFPREVVTCGAGSCGDTGQTICVGGVEDDTCAPGVPAPNDATCDGVDDDCDGLTDEDYTPQRTTCGVGACASTGWRTCVGGVEQNSCVPGEPAANDANCNTVDDDCNGEADEDFPIQATSCGQGPCADVGLLTCENGRVVDSCEAGIPAANDRSCDGVDNDCDGAVDEAYVSVPTTCGVGECQRTGQTFCVNGVVQNSCNPGQPSSDANCDGRDNDCDGTNDEGYVSEVTSCGVGACAANGATLCVNGEVIDNCTPARRISNDDATCNNVDDNCNSLIDEDYVRLEVECGAGSCGDTGETICVNGVIENTCQPGNPAPNDATCDGVDDDCDGQADEDYATAQISCGLGECQSTGTRDCVNGGVQDDCTPADGDANDPNCNGLDDDCDGQIDEDYSPSVTTCGQGVCVAYGVLACQGGAEVDTCIPAAAGDELCGNQLDDDCDGNTDEGFPTLGNACTVGQGICQRSGTLVCSGDRLSVVCSVSPGQPDDNETCDGLDNDCDGNTDEGNPGGGAVCNTTLDGICQDGEIQCVNGALICVQTVFPEAEACDLLDNNCDGQIDEDLGVTRCGDGECDHTINNCLNGVEQVCDPFEGAIDEVCDNNLDDDCDGVVDQGELLCGVGECAQILNACRPNGDPTPCDPLDGAVAEICNDGLDNDCDGLTDQNDVIDCP